MKQMYEITNEGKIVDKLTGEVIALDEIANIISQRNKELVEQNNKTILELGLTPDYALIKNNGIEYPVKKIKEKYEFNKIFRGEVKNVMTNEEIKLSLGARAFIGTYSPFVTFPMNNVIVDNQYLSIESIMHTLEIGKNKTYEILKELESYEIIKRIKMGKQNNIFFNPFLYCAGGVVHKDTYEMFKKSRWSTECIL